MIDASITTGTGPIALPPSTIKIPANGRSRM
jgi:hypothetical protein